jgi:hypothetical protein
MAIMVGCCLFIHMNVKIQTKNPFDEILSLSFDLGLLKVNTFGIIHDSILQQIIKRTHIIKTHLMKKNLNDKKLLTTFKQIIP